jgi:hypothetical protein
VVIWLLAGLALAMLVALAVAYRRGAVRTRPLPASPESADSLAAAIAALDVRHEASDPTLTAEGYATARAALKARLAAVLAGEPGSG